MKMPVLLTACALVALLWPCLSSGQEYFLYQPKASTGQDAATAPEKGVLVRSVTVKRGDTLKKIARRYIGKDWLFPQVLLFNKVRNPDLLHPGDKLLVPVSAGAEGGTSKKQAHRKSSRVAHRRRAMEGRPTRKEGGELRKTGEEALPPDSARPASEPNAGSPVAIPRSEAPRSHRISESAEKGLYRQGRKAYLKGRYDEAALLFGEFLDRYPSSALAADVALFRADCFLHLSEQ